jgi:hypothetical protein
VKKNLRAQLLNKIFTGRAQVFHMRVFASPSSCTEVQCRHPDPMTAVRVCIGACILAVCLAAARVSAEQQELTDVALFKIFLTDGSSVISYGEYARVDDELVFAMPLGSSAQDPRLHTMTLPAAVVDWPRTEQHALSVRFQRYAAFHGEADFARLSAEISAMLNRIATTTDPAQALQLADEARRMLVDWPMAHFGYRQHDISGILTLLDDTVRDLRGTGDAAAAPLSFVTMMPTIVVEPRVTMITPREQVARLVTLVSKLPRSADRIALLRSALAILGDPKSGIDADDTAAVRRSLESHLREELAVDADYAKLARRLTDHARRAAANAHVGGAERVLTEVEKEDAKLGGKRPETVRALLAELQAQLEAARELRLRRDQWQLRLHVYRAYVNSVSVQVSQLVKAQSSLDAIRRLAGPSPDRLITLKESLDGGADRLRRLTAPEQLRQTHDLLVTAWQFAEGAAEARHTAVISGDLAVARQASSAAAGSLLLLARAQAELRSALEPPKLR